MTERKELLAAITTSARGMANGVKAAVVALKAAVELGQTEEDFKAYGRAFHVGYISSACAISASASQAWLDDASIKKAAAKGEQASPYQLAYGASRVAWSRVRDAAGFAKQTNKATRKAAPRDNLDDEADKTVSLAAAIADVRKLASAVEVLAELDQIAAYASKLGDANASVLTGDEGMAARDAIAAILKAVKASRAAPEAKAPKAPRKAKGDNITPIGAAKAA